MKKITIALMFMLLATSVAVAQNDEPKNEISLTYGTPFNTSNMCEFLADSWTGGLSNKKLDKDRYIGPLSVEYFYRRSSVIGYGIIGIFSKYKGVRDLGDNMAFEHNSKYFTIMPAVKVNWLRRDNWGLYSKLALGYTHGSFKIADEGTGANEETAETNTLNFQVSAIGIEAGGSRVRGFAEFGFGEQGMGLAGIRFRF